MRKLTDVTKLHKLGWKHLIEIEEGVEKMYKWYLNQHKNTNTNQLAAITPKDQLYKTETKHEVFNVAFGERTNLNELVEILKENLLYFDAQIKEIEIVHGTNRDGDILHSLASIEKAKELLSYEPKFSVKDGLKEATSWYWENLGQEIQALAFIRLLRCARKFVVPIRN